MTESVASVPIKYGNEYYGTSYESKAIQIPITVQAEQNQDLYVQLMQNLSNVLINLDDPVGTEYPLRFGWNPDVTYWGHFTDIPTPTFISVGSFDTSFTLTFTMSDPRGCLPQESITLDGSKENQITPKGNTFTEPVFSIIPKRDLYYCGYVLNNGQMAIGTDRAEELSDRPPKYEKVVDDPMTTLANWSDDAVTLGSVTTNGNFKIQGSMDSTEHSIVVAKDKNGYPDFGPDVNSWYGPMRMYSKGPTEVLENFRYEAFLHHTKYKGTHNGRAMGRVENLLVNQDKQTIARISIEDNPNGRGLVPICYIQITKPGGTFSYRDGIHHDLFNGSGKVISNGKNDYKVKIAYKKQEVVKIKERGKGRHAKTRVISKKENVTKYHLRTNYNDVGTFSDFYGQFVLEKNGNVWSWEIQRYDLNTNLPMRGKGAYHQKGQWVDRDNAYTKNYFSTVALMLMKHEITEDTVKPAVAYTNCFLTQPDLKIYKINSVAETDPQPIARAGDEIIINTETQQVMVEGRRLNTQWSTDWPKLHGGIPNSIMFTNGLEDAQIIETDVPKIK